MTKKEWKKQNRERERTNNRRWYLANKDIILQKKSNIYKLNPEKEHQRSKKWRDANPNYKKEYLENNPSQLIAARLRTRLYHSIKSNRQGSLEDLLGCTIDEVKVYLESLFLPGMTWDNRSDWHVDHIKPLSSFDLTDPEQLKVAAHFQNLQPLWANDNLRKGKKI